MVTMHEKGIMAISPEQVGVVVVMDRTVVSGLARLALRHRWSLIHLPTAAGVIQTVGRLRVDIAVVHIAVEPQQAVELIRWLRTTRRELLLIAVSSAGCEEIERMARHAGVHCYLPQTDEVPLERAVTEILRHAVNRAGSRQTTDAHSHLRYRGPSGSALTRPGVGERRNLFPSKAGLRGQASDFTDHEPSC